MGTVEKIHLNENKTLKLINALIREIPYTQKDDTQRIAHMMESYLKTKSIKIKGPLISSTSAIKGIENGMPIINTLIIMQLEEPLFMPEAPYRFESELKIGPCLFVRFQGKAHEIQYAYNKITLYSYENNMELDGSSYVVLINQTEESFLADVFMPLKKNGKE